MRKVYLKNKILILILVIATTGCGIKGNPVPYSGAAGTKPQITDLKASSSADSVVLRGKLNDRDGVVKFINVERSEAGAGGKECKNCPPRFDKIGEISSDHRESRSKRVELVFVDKKVVKGKLYTYRLKFCDANGNCSDLATVEINN